MFLVLRPGMAFEYMSGCDLATEHGLMSGCFHFARVPSDTPPALVGMTNVEAFSPDSELPRFEVPVQPFRLEADGGGDGL